MNTYFLFTLTLNAFYNPRISAFLINPDPVFHGPITEGTVNVKYVDEVSGIVASRLHPGIVYVHNDKGDRSRIFALDTSNGHVRATFEIHGAQNYDWEDIAYGKCDSSSASTYCLYIGDTGDHSGDGPRDIIYKVQEPATIADAEIPVTETLHFRWPSSNVDAETLMIDDNTRDLYIISKVGDAKGATMARIPYSAWSLNAVYTLTNLSTVDIHSHHNGPTGGDISPDGRDVLVKTREKIFYWQVTNGNYQEVLSKAPSVVPYIEERHGEAVGWDAQGQGYYTLSEGSHQHLYYYRRS